MSTAFYSSGDQAADEQSQLAAIDKLVELCAPTPAFLDTAWIYQNPKGLHSEEIVGKAVAKHGRDKFVIATKFGLSLPPAKPNSATATIHAQYADSVRRLGSTPDLYYQHRPDLERPIEAVMQDLAAMVKDGKIKYIGLSECTADELRRAHAVHPVTAVQMEWSLAERGIEATLLPMARQLGVAVVAYAPLARGLLTGAFKGTGDLATGDFRRAMPRWKDDALQANAGKATGLHALSQRKGCTPAQLALAWLLSRGPDVFVIPGSKSASRVEENVGALEVRLSPADVAELEALDLGLQGGRSALLASSHLWEARAGAPQQPPA